MANPPGAWTVLPNAFRAALIVALSTALVSGGLLYRDEVSTDLPSAIGDGALAGPQLGSNGLPRATATPGSQSVGSRSQAVLTAPQDDETGAVLQPGSQSPTFARYVYDVDGYERSAAFGQQPLPTEAFMTVDRTPPPEGDVPDLAKNELLFDLYFSEDQQERAIVSYGKSGMAFSYEAVSNEVDPVAYSSESTYDPPVLQIPSELKKATSVKGSSTATSQDDTQTAIVDWTVTVDGREKIDVMGEPVDAWVVSMERRTQPGSGDQVTRSRTYWFDPARGLWVKWEETTSGTEPLGPGSITYTVDYTATLDRIEPL